MDVPPRSRALLPRAALATPLLRAVPASSLPLTAGAPVLWLLVTGVQRRGEPLRVPGQHVLGAARDSDRSGLVDLHAVLRGEVGRHRELAAAEVPVGGKRGVGAFGQRQFEAADGLVGDRLEGAASDAGLGDERVADEIDRDAVTL